MLNFKGLRDNSEIHLLVRELLKHYRKISFETLPQSEISVRARFFGNRFRLQESEEIRVRAIFSVEYLSPPATEAFHDAETPQSHSPRKPDPAPAPAQGRIAQVRRTCAALGRRIRAIGAHGGEHATQDRRQGSQETMTPGFRSPSFGIRHISTHQGDTP